MRRASLALLPALLACAPAVRPTDHGWIRTYRDPSYARVHALAPVEDGVIAGVEFVERADVGDGPVEGLGWDSAVVARYDDAGALRWARLIDTAQGRESVSEISMTGDGDVLAVGYSDGPVDCGLGAMIPNGDFDAWLCAFDGSTGEPLWDELLGGPGSDGGSNLSVDARPGGGAYVAAAFGGTAWFGELALTAEATTDGVLLAYEADGSLSWAEAFGGVNQTYAEGVAATDDGLVLVGTFEGTAELGGQSLVSPVPFGALVAGLDAQGAHRWSHTIAATVMCGVDTDAEGNIYAAASFVGTAEFGSRSSTAQGADVWVLALAPDGTPRWWTSFGGPGDDTCFDLDVDGAEIAVSGWFEAPMLLPGGTTLEHAGAEHDGWLVLLDTASGDEVGGFSFGGAGNFDAARAVGLGGGTRWVGGSFDEGEVVLDGTPLRASTETGFLLRVE